MCIRDSQRRVRGNQRGGHPQRGRESLQCDAGLMADIEPDLELQWLSAVFSGDVELVARMLEDRPEMINASKQDGYDALMIAADRGDEAMVEWLLNAPEKPKIDARSSTGASALHRAILCKRPAVIAQLLEHSADPLAAQNNGDDALMFAVVSGDIDSLDTLLKFMSPEQFTTAMGGSSRRAAQKSPLKLAVAGGHARLLHALCERLATDDSSGCSAALNQRAGSGDGLIHDAVAKGQQAVLQVLLHWKADPAAQNSKGLTPLAIAKKANAVELVEVLAVAVEAAEAQAAEAMAALLEELEAGTSPAKKTKSKKKKKSKQHSKAAPEQAAEAESTPPVEALAAEAESTPPVEALAQCVEDVPGTKLSLDSAPPADSPQTCEGTHSEELQSVGSDWLDPGLGNDNGSLELAPDPAPACAAAPAEGEMVAPRTAPAPFSYAAIASRCKPQIPLELVEPSRELNTELLRQQAMLEQLHPMVSVLDVRVEHLLGGLADELSVSQIEVLETIHRSALRRLEAAKVVHFMRQTEDEDSDCEQ
eukprot:TRINITY_DN8577_c0_g1_i1.p1 TRINITY_DN8577_c0_g1~~TRINITY_DN8577_c0_g1_i1.p1  ORF type:complete len:536 (+),score=179.23 TRINITY_DN8577_c0_g1_i1:66-1673(+)